jgi:OmpA-OmpF porin, OOP family
MKTWSLVVLALVLGGNAWADQGEHGGRPHTHWWLELPTLEWYAGGSVGQSGFSNVNMFMNDGSFTSISSDDKDTSWRLHGGADFGRYVAVELGYSDFGEATVAGQNDGSGGFWAAGPVRQRLAFEGIDLALVGKVPVTDAWILYATAGVLAWDSSFGLSGTRQCCGAFVITESHDDVDLSYGAGLRYDAFLPWRIVAEYRTVTFDSGFFIRHAQVDSIGISLAYLFKAAE